MLLINIRLVLVAQSCLTLCHPFMAHQSPLSMVLRARIVEWITILSSRGSSQHPGIEPRSPALQANSLLLELYIVGAIFREDLNIRFKDPKERIQESLSEQTQVR